MFHVFNPFSHRKGMNLLYQAGVPDSLVADEEPIKVLTPRTQLEHYKRFRNDYAEVCPFPPYPEPGGLLPVGGDTNGGSAFWLMEGRPANWPLVIIPHGLMPIERHAMPLVEFLVRWLSGELSECFDGAGACFLGKTDPVFS
jgi:hypothetical protein